MSLGRVSRSSIEKMFENYADASAPDLIGPEGLERLCEDLNVDPAEDVDVLLLAWRLNASTPCHFARAEFVNGLHSILRVDSLKKLKVALSGRLRQEIDEDPETFKEFYMYAYDYNREGEQKSLQLEVAIALWVLLLRDRFELLELWLEFCRTKTHSVPRDTFRLLLEFSRTVSPDLQNYDENGAWPVLIDEFVEYSKSRFNAM